MTPERLAEIREWFSGDGMTTYQLMDACEELLAHIEAQDAKIADACNATLEEVANYISSAWLNAKSNIEIAKIVRQMKESS